MTLHASTNKEAAGRSSFALGLGLTNECNLACAFCYRDPTRTDRLDLEQVRRAVESVPLRSVNLGTGENGLHPDFAAIFAYLRQKPLKLTMTSNGHSVRILADEDLRYSIIRGLRSREPAMRFRGAADLWSLSTRRSSYPRCQYDDGALLGTPRSRKSSPGLFVVPDQPGAVGDAIEWLLLVWTAAQSEEWRDQIVYVPIR